MNDTFHSIKGLREPLNKFLLNYTGQDVSDMNEEEINGLLVLLGLSVIEKVSEPTYFRLFHVDDNCSVFSFFDKSKFVRLTTDQLTSLLNDLHDEHCADSREKYFFHGDITKQMMTEANRMNWSNGSDERRVAITSMSDNQIQKLVNKEPFRPEKGQWCWFWDDDEGHYFFAQFCHNTSIDKYPYAAKALGTFQYCAPFVGELPPQLKE